MFLHPCMLRKLISIYINTLAIRAFRISDDEHLDEEKNHLLKVFKDNGYKKTSGV